MKTILSAALLFVVVCLFPRTSPGQAVSVPSAMGATGNSNFGLNSMDSEQRVKKQWDIKGRVVTLQGDPVPDAKVEAELLSPSKKVSLKSDLGGNFETSFQFYASRSGESAARLTTKKQGFLPANEVIRFGDYNTGEDVRIILRPVNQEENLLSQGDLVSNLGPRLRMLGSADGLSDKGEKDFASGVGEFMARGNASSAVEYFSKVVKKDTACSKCWSMLALAELDSGDLDGAVRDSMAGATVLRD